MRNPESSLDRRRFLNAMTLSVGGIAFGSLVSASMLQTATPHACRVNAAAWPDPCGDWQLDDICTAYPPYSLHPAAVPATGRITARVDAIDRNWVS